MAQRIAIDATPLLYPGTGIWRVTRALLESMLRLDSPYEFVPFTKSFKNRGGEREILGRKIKRLRLPRSIGDYVGSMGWNELMLQAKVYHATDHFLSLKHSERAVTTIHDLLFLLSPESHFSITHPYFAKHVPAFARRCGRIIAISEHTKHDIIETLKIAPEKIDVIPWAVDQTVFSPSDDNAILANRLKEQHGLDCPYFLAVSCSEGRKNTPRLLEAFMRFAERKPEHKLVVRWNPPPAIKASCQQGVLADQIRFIGPVDDAGLADLYRGATAMFFPTLYEGFGLPILEAMSCGTPVVTARNSSLPEVGGDAAFYIEPLEVDSLIAAFEAFEQGAASVLGLREKGLAQADKFSWERTARMTLAVYAKV